MPWFEITIICARTPEPKSRQPFIEYFFYPAEKPFTPAGMQELWMGIFERNPWMEDPVVSTRSIEYLPPEAHQAMTKRFQQEKEHAENMLTVLSLNPPYSEGKSPDDVCPYCQKKRSEHWDKEHMGHVED